MKTFGRSLVVVVLLLCVAGSTLAAWSMFFVISNIVHVDMRYTVDLSWSTTRRLVILTATVTRNGVPAGAGIDVEFYFSLDGGEWTYFATESTNHRGVARTMYRLVFEGVYEFKAILLL